MLTTITCDQFLFNRACGDPASLFYLRTVTSTVVARCRFHRVSSSSPLGDISGSYKTGCRMISEQEYIVRSVMDC